MERIGTSGRTGGVRKPLRRQRTQRDDATIGNQMGFSMTAESSPGATNIPGPPAGDEDLARSRAASAATNGTPLRQTVRITNAQGFHLRPISAFAQLAASFASNVLLCRDGRTANGKSAWDLMTMLAPPGTEFAIEVDGPDAAAALDALVSLLANLKDPEGEPSWSPEI